MSKALAAGEGDKMADPQMDRNINFNDIGNDFDPSTFIKSIYSAIDDHRSVFGSIPSDIIDTPEKQGSGSHLAEPRINTFFRLLGLPATRDESFLNDRATNRFSTITSDLARRNNALSQGSTLNYFSSIGDQETTLGGIRERNESKKIDTADFNEMINNPLDIDESLKDNSIRRQSLFPLVVDASIPVFPQRNKVAPLFNDGDFVLLGGQTRLKRPFLQHILYMRIKAFSTINDSVKTDLQKNITNEIGNDLINESDLNNFKVLELEIIQKFIQCLKQSSIEYKKTKQSVKEIFSKISYNSVPTNNPESRTGTDTISDEQKFSSSLDSQIQALDVIINKEDLFLMTLPIEKLNRSQQILNLEDNTSTSNFMDDIFISDFISILTYQRDAAKAKKDELLQEKRRLIQKLEQARRNLSYFTGEFYGLSIFDIIGVLYALFTVDKSALVGLLNSSARQRLISDPFFSVSDQTTGQLVLDKDLTDLIDGSVLSLDASLAAIKEKIKEAFSIAKSFLLKTNSDNKPT